jgi:integrase/recombinase XerC/integrase/recombinase XerD
MEAEVMAAGTAQPTAVVQVQNIDTDAVIAMFLQQYDCKDSSRQLYARTLRQFFAWGHRTGRQLQFLTRADVLQYRDGLINGEATEDGNPRSSLTAASYLTSLKLFYTWLESEKVCPNITAAVKLPKRAKKFEREPLTNEQARALVEQTAATATLRDTAIINLLLRCGLRTIEVVRADVGDIKSKGGKTLLYVQGKGHVKKDNFVILSDKCSTALTAYLQTRKDAADTEPLFTCSSNRNKDGRLTTRTISSIAKQHLQGIGLDSRSYTAHSLRHTAACSLLEVTGDMNAVQMTLRHANPATTQLYTYHIDERRRLNTAAEMQLDKLF